MPQLKQLAALGLMCGVLAVLVFRMPPPGRQDIRASRYTQIVQSLYIAPRILVASSEGQPQITYRAPAQPEEARLADWYYRSSYLQGDVQRFNEGSPDGRLIFDLDHQQLARINPAAHTFRPSLAPHGRWIGKLLYAGELHSAGLSLQALDGNDDTIDVLPLAHPFVQEPQSRHGYVSLFSSSPAPQSGSIIHFEAARTEVAHLWLMGDGLLLKLDSPEPECHVLVRIDGRALHGVGGEVYQLTRSSVLLFEDHRPRSSRTRRRTSTWIVRDPIAPDVAYDGRSGLWQRAGHDPLLPRLQSVLSEIAASSPGDVDWDVHLTLSRSAEAEAGQILEDALTSGGTSSTAPAAITLMDAVSGELLALPSWPPDPATSKTHRQNQNFTRHPVGSVAKILFAPAILDTHPALLHLSLPRADSPTFDSVLGLPLNRAIQDDAYGHDLDFSTAIILSSNRFAVTLLTLGSDDPHVRAQGSQWIVPETDDYWIGARRHQSRPTQLIFDPGTPDSLSVLSLSWVARMRHLLDVNVATPLTADRVSRQYIWDGLPAALQPRTPQARRMFDSISPEYENLRLEGIRNTTEDFGSKFASLTLGAGESLWTNVELAEAVSTLLQNRPVRASLVAASDASDSGTDASPSFEYHKLTPAVHQALADAMSGVVLDPAVQRRFHGDTSLRGTASVLDETRAQLAQAACKHHEAFALFAKTGTPTLVEAHQSPEAEVFNEMAKAQLFRLNAAGAIVYTGLSTPAAPGGRVLTRRDLRLLRKLRDQGTGPVAEQFRSYFERPSAAVQEDLVACREERRLRPKILWSRVMGIVADSNETPEFPLVKVDGPVLSYEHQCTTMKTADRANINGRHIVMLAAVYPRAAIMDGSDADCDGAIPHIDVVHNQPLRAVAAVVAIADPQRMKSTLDVAKKLLQGPIAEHLQLQIDTPDQP